MPYGKGNQFIVPCLRKNQTSLLEIICREKTLRDKFIAKINYQESRNGSIVNLTTDRYAKNARVFLCGKSRFKNIYVSRNVSIRVK